MKTSTGPAADTLIGTIQKNRAAEVRVKLGAYKGHDLIDVRVWAAPYNGNGKGNVPTREGVSLSLAKLPELIRVLQAAWAEAIARGLADDA